MRADRVREAAPIAAVVTVDGREEVELVGVEGDASRVRLMLDDGRVLDVDRRELAERLRDVA